MRILIAEDDFASRTLMADILAPYGSCHVAVNGKEAIEAVENALKNDQPYDCICLDIRMPEMNGQEALKTIRQIEQEHGIAVGDGAKIIMTTALSAPRDILDAFNEQCEAYLVKPIRREKLLQQMEKLNLLNN